MPGSIRARLGLWRRRRKHTVLLASFASAGDGCLVYADGVFLGPVNIHLGSDVQIGPGAWLSAVAASITIGNKVTIGPRVAVITGDHNTGQVGVFLHDMTEKRPGDDLPVVIEDDAWIGYGAIILKGVTIGRGSVVGAGAVVTKSVPAYAVVVGNPSRVTRYVLDFPSAVLHEETLYGAVVSDLSHLKDSAVPGAGDTSLSEVENG